MTAASLAGAVRPTGLFAAFADETRLRILNLLSVRELCVCDLCDALEQIQPKVSRHLAVLRAAGLVRVRRRGRWKPCRTRWTMRRCTTCSTAGGCGCCVLEME